MSTVSYGPLFLRPVPFGAPGSLRGSAVLP
jgi:hypothetical protein